MLKSLTIKDFQAHKDTTIEFSPNVTAIVGLNNHGKSSIFRALQKVIRNVPDGKQFINDNATECNIFLETDFGKIERTVKSTNVPDANKYVVDGIEFIKFKITIPVEVKDRLHVSDIQQFGDVEFDLNFQNQLDLLFLLVGPGLPSIRGKVLGRITKTDIVQRAIQLAGSKEKSLQQDLNRNNEEKTKLTVALEKYKFLDIVLERYSTLQICVDEIDKKEKILGIFQIILESLKSITKEARDLKNKLSILKSLPSLEIVVVNQKKLGLCLESLILSSKLKQMIVLSKVKIDVDVDKINRLINISRLCYTLVGYENRIKSLSQRVCTDTFPDVTLYNIKVDRLRQLKDLDSTYKKMLDKKLSLMNNESSLSNDEESLNILKLDLKICPTCQKPF